MNKLLTKSINTWCELRKDLDLQKEFPDQVWKLIGIVTISGYIEGYYGGYVKGVMNMLKHEYDINTDISMENKELLDCIDNKIYNALDKSLDSYVPPLFNKTKEEINKLGVKPFIINFMNSLKSENK